MRDLAQLEQQARLIRREMDDLQRSARASFWLSIIAVLAALAALALSQS